ncbi:unnamed protein product, partial [Symbiodinium sp. CCMP2456]
LGVDLEAQEARGRGWGEGAGGLQEVQGLVPIPDRRAPEGAGDREESPAEDGCRNLRGRGRRCFRSGANSEVRFQGRPQRCQAQRCRRSPRPGEAVLRRLSEIFVGHDQASRQSGR